MSDHFATVAALDMPGTGKLIVLAILQHKTLDVARLMEITGEKRRTVQMYRLQWIETTDETRETGAAGCAQFAKDAQHIAHDPVYKERARLTESPTEISSIEDTHCAREGEEHIGHGVFVNCRTIRHERFTISLPSVEMQFALGGVAGSKDEIAEKARDASIAAALQWGAAIENGQNWRDVVPGNIPGAIRGGFQSMQWRGEVAQKRTATSGGKSFVPFTQNVIRIAARQEVGHDA